MILYIKDYIMKFEKAKDVAHFAITGKKFPRSPRLRAHKTGARKFSNATDLKDYFKSIREVPKSII
jgi:hypothetical protein